MALLNVRNWIVGGIFLFAVVGLGSYLFTNPAGLLKQLFIIGITVVAILVIFRFWSNRSQSGRERHAFAKAAKQSKLRAKRRKGQIKAKSHLRNRPLRKRSTAHLTVIEGKKSKKKDRAIF
ncbi:SA1362 family protein [Siminovitchia sp. 179-K 8D1 HS]|uniref:SA1362 family protein n=1 Tax=Siminovitchia sp. 179-K 8D1 HS TaxID=3142385 RepID=UPI0039A1B7AE